jgi:hypothetical protein
MWKGDFQHDTFYKILMILSHTTNCSCWIETGVQQGHGNPAFRLLIQYILNKNMLMQLPMRNPITKKLVCGQF